MRASGGDGGYGVAFIKRLVRSQTVVTQEFWIKHRAFAYIGEYPGGLWQRCGSDHRPHPGHRLSFAGVYVLDSGVGVRTSQHLGIEHPGKVDIRAIASPAGDLLRAIMTDGPGADHVELLVGKNDVGFRSSYH